MRGEQGAVLVVVALLIPVLVLLATLTVDTANFFVHKRVMQIKADAAALAGAGDLAEQIEAGAGCDTSTVYEAARAYAKERNDADGLGEGTEVRVANPELTSSPCTDAAVDITVRENDVPWIFQITNTVEEIQARARVELQTIGTQSSIAPIGIPLPPDDASILLNGAEYDMVPLDGLDDAGRKLFQATIPGYAMPAATDVDVRFGAGTPIENVGYIRGWQPPTVSGTDAPELGEVLLDDGDSSCLADPGPTPHFFSSEEICAVDISAQIGWTLTDTQIADGKARVFAEVAGNRSDPYELHLVDGRWVSRDEELLIPAGAGPADVTLRWEQFDGKVGRTDCKPRNPCDDDFEGIAARPYSADPDAISFFQIGGIDGTGASVIFGLHSAPLDSTPTLTITVGLKSNLALGGDVRTLRFREVGTNLTGGLTCDGDSEDDITSNRWSVLFNTGCGEPFQVNEENDDCAIERTPRDCVQPRPGNAPDIDLALTTRVAPDGTCSPYDYPGEDDDPRLIAVVLTDYGAFERDDTAGGPQDIPEIPVRGFAWFYVSGWTNNVSQVNTCSNAADVPDNPGDREIYGRYVTRIDQTSPGQIGNGEQCNLNDVYGCVAVMTH